jgi:hypothetical protein
VKTSELSHILINVKQELRCFTLIRRFSSFFSVLMRLGLTQKLHSSSITSAASRL